MTTSITPSSIPRYPVSSKATMRISARWPLCVRCATATPRRHVFVVPASSERALDNCDPGHQAAPTPPRPSRRTSRRPPIAIPDWPARDQGVVDLLYRNAFSWAKSQRPPARFKFFYHPEQDWPIAPWQDARKGFAEYGWAADDIRTRRTRRRSSAAVNWADGSGEHAGCGLSRSSLAAEADLGLAGPPYGRRYDEQQRWVVMRRGQLMIACNLSAGPTCVPGQR